jgi:6-phosphogluconate dehydrogenase
MKLGMVGLGRMGGNMTKRLENDGHVVQTYARSGGGTASSLEELVSQLEPAAGRVADDPGRRADRAGGAGLLGLLDEGDDRRRRQLQLQRLPAARGLAADKGSATSTPASPAGSGGLRTATASWSAARTTRSRSEPAFTTLAPDDGYAHVGPSGGGHFVKMVHNRIENGLMHAYAEGIDIMNSSEFDLDLHDIAGIWRYGSVVRSWLLELLHTSFENEGKDLAHIAGYVEDSGEGRWTVFEAINESVPAPVIRPRVRSLRVTWDESFVAKINAASATSSRPRREERMSVSEEVKAPNPLEEAAPTALAGAVRADDLEPGDLTQRAFPALYALAFRGLLPPKFGVVGVARTEMSDEEFREKMKQAIQNHARDEFRQDVWDEFAESIRYVATDFADQGGEEHVVQCLNELDDKFGTASNRIYYLAVPPSAIETIVVEMGKRRAAEGWTRVIVEKPFGYDLETARHLNEVVHRHFAEEEIFRIDHYLGRRRSEAGPGFANGISSRSGTASSSTTCRSRSPVARDRGARRHMRALVRPRHRQNHLLQPSR